MTKTIVIGGLIAGGFAGLWGCLMCIGRIDVPMTTGMVIGYLTMLIGLSTVFLAVKRRRDIDQGGVIRFWPAFGLGVAISVVAAIVYAIFWELSLSIIGYDAFAERMIAMMQDGASTAREAAETRTFFMTDYRDPLTRFPMTISEMLPVGILVSLVCAALLRNPRFMPARTR